MADYSDIIQKAGQRYNVDPRLISAVIQSESSGNPSAVSSKGAVGLMQIMPATAKQFGSVDLTDPIQNINTGAHILSNLLDKYNDPNLALAAYNAGPGNVDKYKGIPPFPETQAYVRKTMGSYMPAQNNTGAMAAQNALGTPSQPSAVASVDPFGDLSQNAATSKSSATVDPFGDLTSTGGKAAPQAPIATPNVSSLAALGAGIGRGVQTTALGGQELVGHLLKSLNFQNAGDWLINDAKQGLAKGAAEVSPYEQNAPVSTGVGKFIGGAGATAPLALIGAPASIAGAIGTGAVTGALSGALQPVNEVPGQNYWNDKAAQVGLGAATGGVLGPAAYGLGRLISPNVSPEIQALRDKGITPTPGQILGAGATEDKLTSLPVVGGFVKGAQSKAVGQFNTAVYNDALAPIGSTVPKEIPPGSAGVDYVRQQIGKVYKNIEPQATFVADGEFNNSVAAVRNSLAQEAPSVLPQFDNIVKNQISDKLADQAMTGAQWGDSRSMLSSIARKQVLGAPDADKYALADALNSLTSSMNAAVGRNSPPSVLTDLSNANAAWASYKQIEKAAGMAGAYNNSNIFSPAQFTAAVRSGSTASQKATGNGLNADFAQTAQNVLGAKYPDSGTAGRGLLALALESGAYLTGHPYAAAGLAAATLPYTNLGGKVAASVLAGSRYPGFAPVGNALSAIGPAVSTGGLFGLMNHTNPKSP